MKILLIFLFIITLTKLHSQVINHETEEKIRSANSEEYIRAVIKLKEKLNFSDILNNNYGKTKKEKRAYIQLKVINFGNESQGSIISFLNKSKIDGDVKYFSSIYTINSIIIIAKKMYMKN